MGHKQLSMMWALDYKSILSLAGNQMLYKLCVWKLSAFEPHGMQNKSVSSTNLLHLYSGYRVWMQNNTLVSLK